MIDRSAILRSATLLSSGQIIGHGCSFVRNIILARLLGPEHMGVAATFAITVALFSMITELSAGKLLVQARDGEAPRFQATVHLINLIKGLINALLIFLMAWPLTRLFDVSEALWAFQCLALVPLIQSLKHYDVVRLHRGMRFGPSVRLGIASQAIVLAVAWPMAAWLGDYSAVLWLVLLEVSLATVGSHLLAERPFRLACDRDYVKRVMGFGWPLMLNGMLMFGTFQGDRVIVGTFYDMADLGVYSVAFALTLVPTLTLGRINGSLVLPALSRAQDDPRQFYRRYRQSVAALAVIGGTLAAGFILFGEQAMLWLYGPEYAVAGAFIGWLGAMQAVRVLREAPSQAALARGETINALLANIARSIGLLLALWFASRQMPLMWLAVAGLVGEVLAFHMAMYRLWQRHSMPFSMTLAPAMPVLVLSLSAGAVVWLTPTGARGWATCLAAAVMAPAVLAYVLVRFGFLPRVRPSVAPVPLSEKSE